MRNLKVLMAYNGTAYHGYQIQDNAETIQSTVEASIYKLINEKVTINGCSRTDTGVHARGFCFNFKTESRIPCEGFIKGMNAVLPDDIAILSCEEADEGFHSRFDSKGKQYMYRVNCSKTRDVFMQNLAMHYPYELNIEAMREAADIICGTHDFSAFCKAESLDRLVSAERTVYSIKIEKNGDYVDFYIEGNGFLHNMVRIIVGTLIYVSEGKRTCEDVKSALLTADREKAGKTVVPYGLYLNKVFY